MVKLVMSKYTIVTLEEVHSTNSYALEFLPSLDDKTVVFTTHQFLGRGRYDRKWICDDTENLYMSIVLKPEKKHDYPYTNLTQYLSVSVCNVLEKNFGIQPNIKWPNDILVNGAKISGILAETGVSNSQINGVVLGIGLNVNLKQETLNTIDQNATSISVLKNYNYDCETVARMIVMNFLQIMSNLLIVDLNILKMNIFKDVRSWGKILLLERPKKEKNILLNQ